ncbi:SH3 domain protein [Anopheles sinensis]|uniref:SH3 domain protein n=1 Tax=Anopheles sinensis TaxID=74873 RepID=A0A084W3H4_ANOSI|nr:SH3 domain protein [Anopheles sinensis]
MVENNGGRSQLVVYSFTTLAKYVMMKDVCEVRCVFFPSRRGIAAGAHSRRIVQRWVEVFRETNGPVAHIGGAKSGDRIRKQIYRHRHRVIDLISSGWSGVLQSKE